MMPAPWNASSLRRLGVPLLALVGFLACWLVAGLLYALLARPADTFALLNVRGPRGVPTVVWTGSRELARFLSDWPVDAGPLD